MLSHWHPLGVPFLPSFLKKIIITDIIFPNLIISSFFPLFVFYLFKKFHTLKHRGGEVDFLNIYPILYIYTNTCIITRYIE
jgi:hypothetical protein